MGCCHTHSLPCPLGTLPTTMFTWERVRTYKGMYYWLYYSMITQSGKGWGLTRRSITDLTIAHWLLNLGKGEDLEGNVISTTSWWDRYADYFELTHPPSTQKQICHCSISQGGKKCLPHPPHFNSIKRYISVSSRMQLTSFENTNISLFHSLINISKVPW